MGRAPCCDKANVKRGPWSPEEDSKLKSYIEEHGTGGNWIALPQKIGLKRCGKSCRLRWLNYLRPNIKHGGFSEEEDNLICSLYISIGSRWSIIAAQLPGRTDNDIKNYWNTRLKKKLLGKHRKEQQAAHHHHRRSAHAGSLKQHQDIIKRGLIITSSNNSMVNIPVAAEDINSPYWPELPVPAAIPNYSSSPVAAAVVPYIQQVGAIPAAANCFNVDHASISIRKLLIKLGGRFHSHDHHRQNYNNVDMYYSRSDDIEVAAAAAVDDPLLFPRSTQQQHVQQQQIYHDDDEDESSDASHVAALAASCPGGQFSDQMNYQNKMEDIMFQAAGSEGPIISSNYLPSTLHDELITADMYNNNNNNNICPDNNKLDGLEFLYSDEFEDITIMMNHSRRPSTNNIDGEHQTSTSIGWTSGHDDQMQQLLYPPPPPPTQLEDYQNQAGIGMQTQPQDHHCSNFSALLSGYPIPSPAHGDLDLDLGVQ